MSCRKPSVFLTVCTDAEEKVQALKEKVRIRETRTVKWGEGAIPSPLSFYNNRFNSLPESGRTAWS